MTKPNSVRIEFTDRYKALGIPYPNVRSVMALGKEPNSVREKKRKKQKFLLYVQVGDYDDKVGRTESLKDGDVMLDYNLDGELVGIEILNFDAFQLTSYRSE